MTNGDKPAKEEGSGAAAERLVPEAEKSFAVVLRKYSVGLRTPSAETIAEYIGQTGGEDVWDDPEALADRLTKWHPDISAYKRRQILEAWFAGRNIEVPPDTLKTVGLTSDEKAKKDEAEERAEAEKEKRKAKYFYDSKTKQIRGAMGDERGQTIEEAERLADRAKATEEDKEGKGGRAVFTLDKDGNLEVAEGEKLTAEDVAVMKAVGQSQAGGDTRSAFEILKEKREEFQTMQEWTGGGGKRPDALEDVKRLREMKAVLGADEETKTILGQVAAALETLAGGGGASAEVKALSAQVQTLTKQLQENKEQALKDQVTGLTQQISTLRSELKKMQEGKEATSEFGIMSEALKTIDRRASAIETFVIQQFGKPPSPLGEKAQNLMKEAIGQEGAKAAEFKRLGEKLFVEHAKG